MEQEQIEKKSVGAYVYASMFCDKSLRYSSRVLMNLLIGKSFLVHNQEFECYYSWIENNIGIGAGTVPKCLEELEKKGYISTREEGEDKVKMITVNIEKMQQESLSYKFVGGGKKKSSKPKENGPSADESHQDEGTIQQPKNDETRSLKKNKWDDVEFDVVEEVESFEGFDNLDESVQKNVMHSISIINRWLKSEMNIQEKKISYRTEVYGIAEVIFDKNEENARKKVSAYSYRHIELMYILKQVIIERIKEAKKSN